VQLNRSRAGEIAFAQRARVIPRQRRGLNAQVLSPGWQRGDEPAQTRPHFHLLKARMDPSLIVSQIGCATEGAKWTSE